MASADQPSTGSSKLKKKFGRQLIQPFRDLISNPSKSINAPFNLSRSSSTSGAHNSVPESAGGSAEHLVLSSNATPYHHESITSPLQSDTPLLSSIRDRPASTIRQEEGNDETRPSSTSTAEPVSEKSQTEASDWKGPVKENVKVVGRFLQTLLKKSPDYADSNPVKVVLSIVKTLIEIKNAVEDNKDAFAEGLRETETILHSLERIVALSVAGDVERDVVKFKQEIGEEKKNLEELARKLLITQVLDYEQCKTQIQSIFQRIKAATTHFQLDMAINIQIKADQIHNDIKKAALKGLNPSAKADHRTVLEHKTLKREECTAGTRVKIRNQITDWANDRSSDSPRVFWLTGQAGSGKTTIAYTIAKEFEKDGDANQHTVLGGNFFCSTQFQETQGQTRILPTIAYQLAHKCKSYANALYVADKFNAVNHDVPAQMESFLVGPWLQSEARRRPELPPYLIVIDALDEVEDKGGSTFLRSLLFVIDKYDLRGLKFLVTSRSDPDLVKLCEDLKSKAVCRLQDVPIEEAKLDIETYLKDKLPKLARKPELDELVSRAGGLFIYAATAVRYLTVSRSLTGEEQIKVLNKLLSRKMASASNATSLIDELYRQVMWDAFSNLDEDILAGRLWMLHTFLCTAERTSTSVVAGLMADGNNGAAKAVSDDLHAVLYTQDDRVFWYHASFPDFIFDQSRSNFLLGDRKFEFWCDEQAHHNLLTLSCFRMMKFGLRFNMGNIPSSFLFDHDNATALSEQINQNITPALRYSCVHWTHHLPSSQAIDTDKICPFISNFLDIHVLFWIEAMNLLGFRNRCTPMLQHARQWVLKWRKSFLELARDIGSPAAESTPHLYISALATWSQDSSLSRNWRKYFSHIPVFTHTTGNVNLPLMTISAGSEVLAVAFSSDGMQIVSGSDDHSVRVWDASTGTEQKVLMGHTENVNSVAFSSDGMQIVTGSYDKSVRVWDASTGTEQKVLMGHTENVNSVAFSSDGMRIVSGSWDKSVRVWDASTGTEQKVLMGHTENVNSVAFSSDGMQIVSGSYDKSVRVWDASTGTEQKVLMGHTDNVNSVAFSSDGMRIVSGSWDESVRVWDALMGTEQKVLMGHTESVTSVAFSSNGMQIVSGSFDKSVRVWDVSMGTEQKVLMGHTESVNSVVFSSDGMRIVSGSWDNSVRVWDASASTVQKVLIGHTDIDYSVAFSSDGMRIVSGSEDESVRVWNALTGTEQKVLMGHTESVDSVAFSSDGMQIVSGSEDKSVRVWDVSTGTQQKVLTGHISRVTSVAFSSDGMQIVSGSRDKSVRVWDASTGTEQKVLMGHTAWVNSVAFSSNGMRIVSGSFDNSVRVWDASTSTVQKVLMGHTEGVFSVAFSSDGIRIVSGSDDKSVRVWDVSTGTEQKVLMGHTDCVRSVAFLSNGMQIVSGSNDKSVRVWDASTGTEQKVLMGHTDYVRSVAFLSNGMQIVSGSDDKSVRVWDVSTGTEQKVLMGHTESVFSVVFSSDGIQIVSGSEDKSVRVWDALTGTQQKVLVGHTDLVTSVAFSSDGTRIVSGSWDNSVRVWDVSTTGSDHFPWDLTENNWVISSQWHDRLMWVPEAAGLPRPSNILVISRLGHAAVDFSQAKLGTDWASCYTP